MNLQIQYRPKSLNEFIGHESTVNLIREDHKKNNLSHTIMLVGESGTGKTTLAYIIASNLLQCNKQVIKEINAADARGIDEVRDITRDLGTRPLIGDNKVFIIDEAHQLTTPAQNALLKPLESEHNTHVYFIFCTTNPNSIIKTIKNRCTTYALGSLSVREIVDVLRPILKAESINLPEDIIKLIVTKADGIPRQAVKLLDQLRNVSNKTEAERILKEFGTNYEEFDNLAKFLRKPWSKIGPKLSVLYEKKAPESIRMGLLAYYSVCLQNCSNPQEAEEFCNIMEIMNDPIIYMPHKSKITLMLYKINRILIGK